MLKHTEGKHPSKKLDSRAEIDQALPSLFLIGKVPVTESKKAKFLAMVNLNPEFQP